MFGKKLKNTGFQPYGGLEMRHFEKTGENRQMVSGKKKLSFLGQELWCSFGTVCTLGLKMFQFKLIM